MGAHYCIGNPCRICFPDMTDTGKTDADKINALILENEELKYEINLLRAEVTLLNMLVTPVLPKDKT